MQKQARPQKSGVLDFFHESDHALSFIYNHYDGIIVSKGYNNNSLNQSDIIAKYLEASAITVTNKISEELGWHIKDSYYRYGFYINKEWYEYAKPELYGAFPHIYTNGNATILKSFGPAKYEYYKMRGDK